MEKRNSPAILIFLVKPALNCSAVLLFVPFILANLY